MIAALSIILMAWVAPIPLWASIVLTIVNASYFIAKLAWRISLEMDFD